MAYGIDSKDVLQGKTQENLICCFAWAAQRSRTRSHKDFFATAPFTRFLLTRPCAISGSNHANKNDGCRNAHVTDIRNV